MSDNRSLTVVSIPPSLGKPALAGGLIGAELGLFLYASIYSSLHHVVLATLIPALVIAGIASLVAVSKNEDNEPVKRMEKQSGELRKLLEKELINADEYEELRRHLIDDIKHGTARRFSVAKHAAWGALFGALVPLMISASLPPSLPFGFYYALALLVPGALGAGGTAAAAMIAHRAAQRNRSLQLGSGEPARYQQLGTRSRDR